MATAPGAASCCVRLVTWHTSEHVTWGLGAIGSSCPPPVCCPVWYWGIEGQTGAARLCSESWGPPEERHTTHEKKLMKSLSLLPPFSRFPLRNFIGPPLSLSVPPPRPHQRVSTMTGFLANIAKTEMNMRNTEDCERQISYKLKTVRRRKWTNNIAPEKSEGHKLALLSFRSFQLFFNGLQHVGQDHLSIPKSRLSTTLHLGTHRS